MNRKYISTTVFRRYLGLLAASGLKLPETISLKMNETTTREFTVLHRIDLSDSAEEGVVGCGKMIITSWVISPELLADTPEHKWETLSPEFDWAENGYFWVGKAEKVYADYSQAGDKRLNGFGWCGNAERQLAYPTFYKLTAGPIFTIELQLGMLDQIALPPTITVTHEARPAKDRLSNEEGGGMIAAAIGSGTEVLPVVPPNESASPSATVHREETRPVFEGITKAIKSGGAVFFGKADSFATPA